MVECIEVDRLQIPGFLEGSISESWILSLPLLLLYLLLRHAFEYIAERNLVVAGQITHLIIHSVWHVWLRGRHIHHASHEVVILDGFVLEVKHLTIGRHECVH